MSVTVLINRRKSAPCHVLCTGGCTLTIAPKFPSEKTKRFYKRQWSHVNWNTIGSGTCKLDEFTCGNGNCIKNNVLCDSYDNCGNDSDEKNCGDVCGEKNCGDGSDEKNCAKTIMIVGIVVGCVVVLAVAIRNIVCYCGWVSSRVCITAYDNFPAESMNIFV